MNECFDCKYFYVPYVCLVPMEGRRVSDPLEQDPLEQLRAAMWVPGLELGSSGRADLFPLWYLD